MKPLKQDHFPALVLAGGRSRRMGGQPKAFLSLSGGREEGNDFLGRMVRVFRFHTRHILVNLNEVDIAVGRLPNVPILPDVREGFCGPLAGVEAGLLWMRDFLPQEAGVLPGLICAPCDAPFLPADFYPRIRAQVKRQLAGRGKFQEEKHLRPVMAVSNGRCHWTHGFWPLSALEEISRALDEERLSVGQLARDYGFEGVAFDNLPLADGQFLDPFMNINTPDDLALARKFHALLEGGNSRLGG